MGGKRASARNLVIQKWLVRLADRFMGDESGQATVEYILILSVSVLGAGAIMRAIIKAMDEGILHFGSTLEKDLRTGRAPPHVWKN